MKLTHQTGLPGRVWDSIERDPSTDCWVWLASHNGAGYGQVMVDGLMWRVHRLVYVDQVGEIPDGLVLDHLCRNRGCCNPAHLEPVTDRVNVVVRADTACGINSRKTHCDHGHEFTPENTRTSTGRYGFTERHCRACGLAKYHASKAAWNTRRAEKVPCPECGGLFSRSSLTGHRKRKHLTERSQLP